MDINERGKNLILASMLFLIFGAFLMIVSNETLKKINDMYIRQNMAIVGSLSKEHVLDESKIIGIITKGDTSNYKEGEKILNKYSYKEGLDLNLSPVMKNAKAVMHKNLGVIWGIISIMTLVLIYLKDRKNLKISKELIKRANKIVEGDFSEKENYKLKDGAFETLYESFALMEERIKKDIEDLKRERLNLKNIINDISHQLKTPLTALLTYNHILKDYKNMPKEDVDNFIDLSFGQLERMDWLTITLLKYARLEGDVVEYKKEYISLLDTVYESVEPLRIKAREKNQTISIEHKGEKFIFYHDKKWLNEALSNIVKNGIEHTKEKGKIEILIKESTVYLEIVIKDNGEGISEEFIKKIFNRFYKISSSKKPKSIGIGLALSKSIIEKHNGEIRVKSKVGEGTAFTIKFIK